ncbi:DUF3737 family protein [Bifidobacterium oedipodis]|uniref:DUF3737 family protein n=1 Tax=Bifidobacterium oedipodis TaxID=2675322 RepID=UPI00145D31A7
MVTQEKLIGERAAFFADHTHYDGVTFADGESPLKHAHGITLTDSSFQWKYPLWYASDVHARRTTWLEMARAGVWYTHNITVEDCVIEAPKNFRRSTGVTLKNVQLPNAEETLWNCSDVTLDHVSAQGDYFAMNLENARIDHMSLDGNYPFDGAKNITVSNSRMLSKDAFWNAENITVTDSYICGEYLGWNSKNLTFVNCTIESLQGLCYIDNLVMRNCRLINTTLAFEYSTVDAELNGIVDSVFNPTSGRITADSIREITLDPKRVDPNATMICCRDACRSCR